MDSQNKNQIFKIFISAGHYPEKSGAANLKLGLKEYFEAKKIVDVLLKFNDVQPVYDLIPVEPGSLQHKVRFIEQRLNPLDKTNGAIAIEIHFNAFQPNKATGIETLYYKGSQEGKSLAISLFNSLFACLPFHGRGVKCRSDLYFLSAISIPSVIAEILFIDNDHEASYLLYDRAHALIATAIFRGIKNYCDKFLSPPLQSGKESYS